MNGCDGSTEREVCTELSVSHIKHTRGWHKDLLHVGQSTDKSADAPQPCPFRILPQGCTEESRSTALCENQAKNQAVKRQSHFTGSLLCSVILNNGTVFCLQKLKKLNRIFSSKKAPRKLLFGKYPLCPLRHITTIAPVLAVSFEHHYKWWNRN